MVTFVQVVCTLLSQLPLEKSTMVANNNQSEEISKPVKIVNNDKKYEVQTKTSHVISSVTCVNAIKLWSAAL